MANEPRTSQPKAQVANPTAREQEREDKQVAADRMALEEEAARMGISADVLQTIRREAQVSAEKKIRKELAAEAGEKNPDQAARDESAAINEARQLRAKRQLGPKKGEPMPKGAVLCAVRKTFHISPDDIPGFTEGGASIEVEPGDLLCLMEGLANSLEARGQVRIT